MISVFQSDFMMNYRLTVAGSITPVTEMYGDHTTIPISILIRMVIGDIQTTGLHGTEMSLTLHTFTITVIGSLRRITDGSGFLAPAGTQVA
jgi:high-affinity nickel permease